jgi:hypothetical protein
MDLKSERLATASVNLCSTPKILRHPFYCLLLLSSRLERMMYSLGLSVSGFSRKIFPRKSLFIWLSSLTFMPLQSPEISATYCTIACCRSMCWWFWTKVRHWSHVVFNYLHFLIYVLVASSPFPAYPSHPPLMCCMPYRLVSPINLSADWCQCLCYVLSYLIASYLVSFQDPARSNFLQSIFSHYAACWCPRRILQWTHTRYTSPTLSYYCICPSKRLCPTLPQIHASVRIVLFILPPCLMSL